MCQEFHRKLDDLLEHNPLSPETNRVLEDAAKAIDGPLDFFVLFANQRIGWTPDERSTLDYKMSIHGFQRKGAAPPAAPDSLRVDWDMIEPLIHDDADLATVQAIDRLRAYFGHKRPSAKPAAPASYQPLEPLLWGCDDCECMEPRGTCSGCQKPAAPHPCKHEHYRYATNYYGFALVKLCEDCGVLIQEGEARCPHDKLTKALQEKIDAIKHIVASASADYDQRPYWLVSIDMELKDDV